MREPSKKQRYLLLALCLLMASASPYALLANATKVTQDIKDLHTRYIIANWRNPVLGDSQQIFPETNWWEQFKDPVLNHVVEQALKNNPDLASMQTRIEQAKALSHISRADMFPQISVGAQYLYQQYARNQYAFPLPGRTFQSASVPLTVSYEADIWGKNLLAYRSAKRQVDAAALAYQNARLQLIAGVVTTYLNAARFNKERALQELIQQEAEKELFHEQQLFNAEQVSAQDLNIAQFQSLQAKTTTETFITNAEIARNQLVALMGESPSKLENFEVTSIDDIKLPESLTTGLPQALLTRRPDIAQIEASLKSADLDVSVARREFLPTIRLSGQSGFAAVGLHNVFKWKNISSFFQPILSLPIFSGGLNAANLKLKKSQYQDLLYQYQSSIINAYTEAENALATVNGNQKIYREIMEQLNQSTEKATHQKLLLENGLAAEPLWLASDIERLEVSKLAAQQKTQVLVDTVGVIKALGGGFNETATK